MPFDPVLAFLPETISLNTKFNGKVHANPEGTIAPRPILAKQLLESCTELPAELIMGVLRRGAKMSLTGRSKAGKSFAMIELAVAVAIGGEWIGHKCEQGNVLYLNFELQSAEMAARYKRVKKALGVKSEEVDDCIAFWNLRGYSYPLWYYASDISDFITKYNVSLVIIDPIYKLINGSENDQEVVTDFCNTVDAISGAGASVVYVHHHRKGALGNNEAQDRGSGSGVFARDADAILDMIQLTNPGGAPIDPAKPSITAWRLSYVLRSFESPGDKTVLFDYPIHRIDTTDIARNASPNSSQRAGGEESGKRSAKNKENNKQRLKALLGLIPNASDEDISNIMGVTDRTIRTYKKEIEAENN